jgi:hypothetical protein
MRIKVNRTIALVVAGLAVAGGGTAALAASSSEERQALLADAAERLGVQPSELETALEEAAVARVDAAVEAGTLTEEQAAELKERIRSGAGPLLGGPGLGGPGFGHHHGGPGGLRAAFDAAAEYLGLGEEELRAARADGTSLAELAEQQGLPVAGLKQAMAAAVRAELDEAVESGALTTEQRSALLEDLETKLDGIVSGEGFGAGRGFGPPLGGIPGEVPDASASSASI